MPTPTAIKPKKILWPTDLSEHSLKGAQYARVFCETFGARLHVMHVAPIIVGADPSVPMMSGGDILATMTDTITPAKGALARLIAMHLRGLGKIESTVITGNAWHEICRYADKSAIDLIIISTHGLTGFQHLLMGSTAERIVQHAKCPVLTVKSFEREFIGKPGKSKAGKSRQKS